MNYDLIIRSCAEKDISTSIFWYENRRKGLGASLQNKFEEAFKLININPKSFPVVYKNIRRALVKKFPYSIFYIFNDKEIIILAVYHEKRNPDDWKKRV